MGLSVEKNLPQTWSADSSNVRWKTEIPGEGISSPIVSNGRVFLTAAHGEQQDGAPTEARSVKRVVLGLDLETGELLWETPVLAAPLEKKHHRSSYATPTPVTDGEHVFAYFGSVLASVDFGGTLLWKREIDPTYARYSRYGAASSPVLTDAAVIVVQDREYDANDDPGWMAAFEKETGREIWRTDWRHTCCSYTSPLLWGDDSGARLLFAHSGGIAEYDAASGERLWEASYPIGQTVPSPVASGDLLCVTGGDERRRGTLCMRLSGRGKDTKADILWGNPKDTPKSASPIFYDGKLFTLTSAGVMTCWDAETGDRCWQNRIRRRSYHASLVAGDGKIYAIDTDGHATVVAAGPQFELLAENDLGEGSDATPAIAGGCLLIRTARYLYCIEKEVPAGAA